MRPMLESQRRALRSSEWERKGLSLSTKLSVYKAIVLTTLLYASEVWTVHRRHAKKLNRFHLNCLRKLLRVKWQDKVPDTEILEQTGMSSIFTMLRKTQLRWASHVVRTPDERLSKRILYGNFWLEHAPMEVRGSGLKTLWKTLALTTTCGKWQPKTMQPRVELSTRERQRMSHGVWKQRRASTQQESPAQAVVPKLMTLHRYLALTAQGPSRRRLA